MSAVLQRVTHPLKSRSEKINDKQEHSTTDKAFYGAMRSKFEHRHHAASIVLSKASIIMAAIFVGIAASLHPDTSDQPAFVKGGSWQLLLSASLVLQLFIDVFVDFVSLQVEETYQELPILYEFERSYRLFRRAFLWFLPMVTFVMLRAFQFIVLDEGKLDRVRNSQ